jgi:hypothetical protein
MMELTYGQLEATLVTHFRVHPDRVGTFRSRIKQLQRLQFPPGVNVGRGAKMVYTGEHLLMLTTAFHLIGSGLPAQSATALVAAHWDHFSAGYALAALQERRIKPARPNKIEPVLAVLVVSVFHDIQFEQGDPDTVAASVGIFDKPALEGQWSLSKHNRNHARWVLSISAILTRVLRIAKESAGVESNEFDHEFHDWLPKDDLGSINFRDHYPDRSNIKMRQYLHRLYSNDPESVTPEGQAEAEQFLHGDYSMITF